ncbi:hypothetical protein R1sor_018938 [Riccia sorocarpa]|uniref:YqaJ viral recombinase domain-containing protein n=1 Tax=Riccia sorocarpa TaxID=122646 RepID=A0ABD3IF86_9MARC
METAAASTLCRSLNVIIGREWGRRGCTRRFLLLRTLKAECRPRALCIRRPYSTELAYQTGAERRPVWDSCRTSTVCGRQEKKNLKDSGRDSDSALRHVNYLERQKGLQVLRQALQINGVDPSPAAPSPSGEDLEVPLQGAEVLLPDLAQGTQEWLNLRKNRITASAFSTALGFWKGDRRAELWEEKIGLREPFSGNEATKWGSTQEAGAVEKYKTITGNNVEHVAFKIYKAGDEYLSWLGASPDGLIIYKNDEEQPRAVNHRFGVLEVKCPHNKGRPESGAPWDMVPAYYMPQAQGLLEIYDREIMDFYVWTVNGSAVFRINRDPEYWGFMFRIMSELWWGHIVPASIALKKGKSVADVQIFRPSDNHAGTAQIVQMSRDLARKSPMIWREHKGDMYLPEVEEIA